MDINYDRYSVFDYTTISRCSPFRLCGRTISEKLITAVSPSSPGRTPERIGSVNLFLPITNCKLFGSYSFRNFRVPKRKLTARTRFAVGRVIYSRHYFRLRACVCVCGTGFGRKQLSAISRDSRFPRRHVHFTYRKKSTALIHTLWCPVPLFGQRDF